MSRTRVSASSPTNNHNPKTNPPTFGLGWESRLIDSFLEKRLVINIGKGGVGKSSLTAALAQYASSKGKRVLICEINAKERMAALFEQPKPPHIETLEQIWKLDENIWTVNIEPRESMKEYIVQVLKLRLLYNVVFENQLMRHFLRAVPGLQELVYIGKVWFHVMETLPNGQPRFDLVLVDSPATGHGLAMLRIPQVVINTVPVGPMHSAAQRIKKLLEDPTQTQLNLITLPEEMPVNETLELYEKLTGLLQIPIGTLFVNQWPQTPLEPQWLETFRELLPTALKHPQAAPLFAIAQDAQTKLEKALKYMHLLEETLSMPCSKIPQMPGNRHEPTVLRSILSLLQAPPDHDD